MQPLDKRKSRRRPGFGAGEQPSIEEQRLGDKQHQGKQQPHCHHRVHPPIFQRQKAVPQIEPDDHVKAGEPGQHRRDARLPAKTPLDGLEEDDPFLGAWRSRAAGSNTPQDTRSHANCQNY
jgi:hypothetical protein